MTPSDDQLAIHGGTPLVPEGPPTWPPDDPAIWEALQRSYSTGMWGRYYGDAYAELSKQLCQRTHSKFAWLCASGTIAVELALRALKVGPGDEVLIAAYDFPGNFRAIENVGATPVLVDLEPSAWRMDLQKLDAMTRSAAKVVIATHLHGELMAMDALSEWADSRGLSVVEDACQCPGAFIAGRPAGSWGTIGVFSFGGSKLLTAGRGGALVTDREDVYQRIKISAERGNDAFPLSELQATVLLPQLESLDERNDRRRVAALAMQHRLESSSEFNIGPRTPIDPRPRKTALGESQPSDAAAQTMLSTFYKFPLRLPEVGEGKSRQALIDAARAEGIALDIGFRGFTRRSAQRCRRPRDLVEAERAAQLTVLLHHPVLLADEDQFERTMEGLQRVMKWWLR